MSSFQISHETSLVYDILSACPHGEVVTFDEMSRAVGHDIRETPSVMQSARRIAQREHGAIFDSVRNVGYKRLHPDECHKVGQAARRKIGKQARRGAAAIRDGIAGANEIDPASLRKALVEQSVLGVMAHLSRDKSLPEVAEGATKPMPVREACSALLEHIGAR